MCRRLRDTSQIYLGFHQHTVQVLEPLFLRGFCFYSSLEFFQRAGVGLLIAPPLSASMFEFMDKRVASLHFWVGFLNLVCAYVPNSSFEYPILSTSNTCLKVPLLGLSIVLPGNANALVGNDSETLKAVIGSGDQLLDFCVSCSFSITNTMLSHKNVHKYILHQDTLG